MHFFLYVVIIYIFYVQYATSSDPSNHFKDYINEISKTVGFLRNSDFPEPGYIKNLTNIKRNSLSGVDNTFSKSNIQKLLKDDHIIEILNILKLFNKQLTLKYENEINKELKHNKMNSDNENLEEYARQLVDEGRKVKTKKLIMKALVGLKVLTIGVILPMVLGIALFASWKGVTISLMALLLAGIISLKSIVGGKNDTPQHVIVSPLSNHHQHWWRKTEGPEVISWDTSHELAYSGHR